MKWVSKANNITVDEIGEWTAIRFLTEIKYLIQQAEVENFENR